MAENGARQAKDSIILPYQEDIMTDRRALCVGINKFKNYPSAALQGCVSDANDMASVLKSFMGFAPADVTVLTDARATKAAIMGGLKEMVRGGVQGSYKYLVFSLSSHGTQVPDASGDEPDRADEAFCPHDLARAGDDWDPGHIIVDDEFRDLFIQLPSGVLLEVYLDTCHSGTGLRAIDLMLDRKPRFLTPPSVKALIQAEGRRPRGLARGLLEKGAAQTVLWAACRADQTSADADISDGWHGAFTYYFCKEIRAGKNRLSRAKLLQRVRADLSAGSYNQVPQLECGAAYRAVRPGP
jgi:hypothetical protein